MSSRRITIPETILFKLPGSTSEPAPHPFVERFLTDILNADRRFGQLRERVHIADELERAFAGKQPGDFVDLRESDWKVLRDAVEQPQFGAMQMDGTYAGFHPALARAAISYLDAVCDAPKVPAHPVLRDTDKDAGAA